MCFHQDFKDKIKNVFAPTNYGEGLDNKAVVGMSKDAEAGGKVGANFSLAQNTNADESKHKNILLAQDDLEKVITGYQPVPQNPPASYPQGANSLPRCQVQTSPKFSKTNVKYVLFSALSWKLCLESKKPAQVSSKGKEGSLPRGASLPR